MRPSRIVGGMTTETDALDRLRSATDSYNTATQMTRHLRAERDRAIHAAALEGCTQQAIGDVVGLKREQVRLIRDAVEAGNAGQPPKPRPRRRPRASV